MKKDMRDTCRDGVPSSGGSGRRRAALLVPAVLTAAALGLSACGTSVKDANSSTAASCVDTSGPTIKVGSLNSLSGTMAISEVTVRNAIQLAVEQINAAGGVLG